MGAPYGHHGTMENHLRGESGMSSLGLVLERVREGEGQSLPGGTYKMLKVLCTWVQEGGGSHDESPYQTSPRLVALY